MDLLEKQLSEKYNINFRTVVHSIIEDIIEMLSDSISTDEMESIFNVIMNKLRKDIDTLIELERKEDADDKE